MNTVHVDSLLKTGKSEIKLISYLELHHPNKTLTSPHSNYSKEFTLPEISRKPANAGKNYV